MYKNPQVKKLFTVDMSYSLDNLHKVDYYNYLGELKEVFEHLPIDLSYKYTSLTIEHQFFQKNESTSYYSWWHCDGAANPLIKRKVRDENIFIYVSSQYDLHTEFILGKVNIDIDLEDNVSAIDKKIILAEPKPFKIENNTFYNYSSKNFHRARIATENSERLFIRIMQSDIIKPERN